MSFPLLLGAVDSSCPLDWSHPLNSSALAADFSVLPNDPRAGLTWRDNVRGAKRTRHGTISGPTWVGHSGRPGGFGGLSFDGSNDYVAAPSLSPTTKFTIACWMRTTSPTTRQDFVQNQQDSWTLRINQDLSSVQWITNTSGYVTVTSSKTVAANKWYHIAATYDGSSMVLYQDGVPVGSASQSGNLQAVTGNVLFGVHSSIATNWFTGILDCVQLYLSALSASQIASLHAETKAGNPCRWNWISLRTGQVPGGGGGGTTYPASLAGSVGASGSLTFAVAKSLVGSSTATGSLAKAVGVPLAGSSTAAASLAKAIAKAASGSCAGSGGQTNAAGKGLSGSTTGAGGLSKAVAVLGAGSSTASGAVSTLKSAALAAAGAVTAAGSLVRAVAKYLAGLVTGSGGLSTSGGSPGGAPTTRAATLQRADPERTFRRADAPRLFQRPDASRIFQRIPSMSAAVQRQTRTKKVSEVVLFVFDFSNFPEVEAGETLSNPSVPAVSGLTIGSPAITAAETDGIAAGKALQVSISGGTAGTDYTVSAYVTTSGGSTRGVEGVVAVRA